MPTPLIPHEPLLVNTIGHFTGALVFGVFLFLLMRNHVRAGQLSLCAAGLAFVWNLSSLSVLVLGGTQRTAREVLVALGTSALSLLPAVLLHLSLGTRFRAIVASGYATSVIAVVLHAAEHQLPSGDWHRNALLLTTAGFAVLTSLAAVLLLREGGRSMTSRLFGAMSLFLFSLSLVHSGSGHGHDAWSVEMLVHHAGVPLALIVLMQDYRFLLLDTFARILASFLLAGGLLYLTSGLARLAGVSLQLPGTPIQQGLMAMSLCLLMLVYALLRSQMQAFLTRVLFGRSDLDRAVAGIRALCSSGRDEAGFVEQASRHLADFLGADLRGDSISPSYEPEFPVVVNEAAGAGLVVPLRFGPGDVRCLFLGPRRGGRRYLSEDLQAAARIAAQIVEHVEHLRAAEMRRLVTQAELRALESQIHPHFLFNALNTLFGVIPRGASEARRTVLNLADVLRYILRADKTFIGLAEELRVVEAYLEIEALRLGPRLRTEIDVPADLRTTPIPVLSLQPLVENAVKHAVAAKAEGGLVRVAARQTGDGITVSVEDTGPGFPAEPAGTASRGHGIALSNVSRRLDLCYGPPGALRIHTSPEGSRVEFTVPAESAVPA